MTSPRRRECEDLRAEAAGSWSCRKRSKALAHLVLVCYHCCCMPSSTICLVPREDRACKGLCLLGGAVDASETRRSIPFRLCPSPPQTRRLCSKMEERWARPETGPRRRRCLLGRPFLNWSDEPWIEEVIGKSAATRARNSLAVARGRERKWLREGPKAKDEGQKKGWREVGGIAVDS